MMIFTVFGKNFPFFWSGTFVCRSPAFSVLFHFISFHLIRLFLSFICLFVRFCCPSGRSCSSRKTPPLLNLFKPIFMRVNSPSSNGWIKSIRSVFILFFGVRFLFLRRILVFASKKCAQFWRETLSQVGVATGQQQ